MSPSRRARINRRRLVAPSMIGGAATLATGQPLSGAMRTSPPARLLAQDSSTDVQMFRGNAARTGEMPGSGPDHSNGVEAIWKFPTGGTIRSSAAVADGVVYVGSNDYNLYAVDPATGTERWRFATGDSISSLPAVVGGVVYIGINNSETEDGYLYAIGARVS